MPNAFLAVVGGVEIQRAERSKTERIIMRAKKSKRGNSFIMPHATAKGHENSTTNFGRRRLPSPFGERYRLRREFTRLTKNLNAPQLSSAKSHAVKLCDLASLTAKTNRAIVTLRARYIDALDRASLKQGYIRLLNLERARSDPGARRPRCAHCLRRLN